MATIMFGFPMILDKTAKTNNIVQESNVIKSLSPFGLLFQSNQEFSSFYVVTFTVEPIIYLL